MALKLSVWLVYENVPETTDSYFIHYDFLTEEDHKVLDLCHNNYINTVDTPTEVEQAMQSLSLWLGEGGKFHNMKLSKDRGPYAMAGDTKLIITGFIL